MDIQTLTTFFMWCSIINGGILLLWGIMWMILFDWIYRLQSSWFPMSKDVFYIAMYALLALFKILVLIFNVVPYLVLLIISS